MTRIGPQHQAGSDSLLTCTTFFKMRQMFFDDRIDDQKYLGYLYGLRSSPTAVQSLVNATSNVSLNSSDTTSVNGKAILNGVTKTA